MALTLIESAKIALGRDEDLKFVIMELYARTSDILQNLPFETITGNALTFNREKTLPAVGFRGVNEAFAEGTGKVDKVTESLAIAGGDLDVDKFLVDTGGPGQRASQEAMKVKALSLSMTKEIIKGDILTTPRGFDGLQVRILGNQLITPAATALTGACLHLAKLDELIDAVEDPTHLIMNKNFRRKLTSAARDPNVSGYITYDVDAFGRRVTKYNDLPILIADKDNEDNDILPQTETVITGAKGCSIYCVSFAENGVVGLQSGEMDVRDLGEIDDKPVYRTRVEWYITLALLREKAAGRLRWLYDLSVKA